MTEKPDAAVPGPSRQWRRLQVLWTLLLGVNVILLAVALPPVLRGDADAYQNEHARMVAGAATGVFLCAGYLARSKVQIVVFIAAFASMAVSIWLSSGYAR